MPIKKPAELSYKWWQKNVPSSLPRNKKIETCLKAIDGTPMRDAMKAISDAENLIATTQVYQDQIEPYVTLVDELKRYRAVITKTKESHTDLVDAIEVMVRLAKSNVSDLAAYLKAAKDAGELPPSRERGVMSGVQRDMDTIGPMRQRLTRIRDGAMQANDKETFAGLISQNRKLQQVVKERIKATQSAFKRLESPSREATQAVGAYVTAATDVMKLSRAIDTLLVRQAVAALGEEKGKALFLKTEAAARLR